MVINSTRFLVAFCEWVTRENNDLVGQGADSKDAWKLLSHCIRTVFKELHKARMAGRGPFIGDKCGAIVWGQMQAHKRMNEFTDNGFSADPTLSHILNLHLQDNAVMQSSFSKLKDKVTNLENIIAQTKKVGDQAKSIADRALKSATK